MSCPYGGTEIQSGLDANGDGILQTSEVTSVNDVCNGAPGSQGDAGAPGLVSLISVTAVGPGMQCAQGGQLIQTGLDTNGDGMLEPGEVQNSAYICNGP